MKRKLAFISILFMLGVLLINPFLGSKLSMLGSTLELTSKLNTITRAPPVPQDPPDWIQVSLETEYFYNESAIISWYGRPQSGTQSPFNPLFGWTKSGSIDGGFWEGNPGNATITAVAWDNETTATEVSNFLNYTMRNYVRFASWPSLNIFNFTQYENTTLWEFTDAITSHEEFLNTTFYLVNNSTGYLMDGFNATGIVGKLTEYRVHLEWYENDPIAEVSFSYTITNATELKGATYIFSLGRAMGLTAPLNMSGTGTLTFIGPYDRMIINGTPTEVFENVTFPYFPIGTEVYSFDELEQDFDYTIWFRKPTSALTISRELSTTELGRGEQIRVKITVINTGDISFSVVTIRDVQAIEQGNFQLISGRASIQVTNLQPDDNVTLEYNIMALVTGDYEYPGAQVIGIDAFNSQYTCTSSAASITIGNGLLPSEMQLIQIGIAIIFIVIIFLLLYRFRRRIF